MKKLRPLLSEYEMEQLENLSKFDFTGWKEADVREDFIKPLLDLLGYHKTSDYEVSREDSYKLHPFFLQVGRKRIELDYLCSIRKNKFWIIEAKSAENKDIKTEEIEQAYFYSLHQEVDCPYFLVSNGWYINLYKRDELDEKLSPVLSISSDSLTTNFFELDSYIGSTQILPHLKNEILTDIQKVLSTEIYTGRLDEFIKEVEATIGSIRGAVIENFKKNAEIENQKSDENLKYLIESEKFYLTPHSIFNAINTVGMSKKLSNLVLERFKESSFAEKYLFLSNLLLEEPKAVTSYYYSNVLRFLIDLHKSGIKPVECYVGNTTEEILVYWIKLLLFGLGERVELRYLWAFEGLINRLTSRALILEGDIRNKINSVVDKELYELSEELVAFKHPHPAEKIIKTIENQTIITLSQLLRLFYHKGKFDETLCYEKYLKFKNIVETFENDHDDEYWTIKKELGSSWETLQTEAFLNHYFDRLSSATCSVLESEPEILKLLNDEERERLKLLASIRIDDGYFENSKLVNFAGECCEVIGIKAPETKISLKKAQEYFDPKEDPFSFKI